jgi:hypothetical protein
MRYESGSGSSDLMLDAERVSHGIAANQSQESLDDQLKDLHVLATRFGLYDAADWLRELVDHRERFQADYGKLPQRREIDELLDPFGIGPRS